ncbi:MAG: GNAT family N-acetyltransferase [Chloroflexi bacterium]|nr:GNAT family N-acetyltransferase [Chloroflexota bacterium]MCI0577292.1 GNAT family N-acetyltransferase [Chloroflexota bacterium]MCI0647736.1 GNAT family N-acetyltransferase [Chloroflexota bacterium]MCI0731600.1 GNAT family N-acetyltransferase [Chloroflexota bacterium]
MSGDVHTFRAKNGLLIRLRPLTPADVPHLVNLFEHLGPDSRLMRFNLSLENPDPELVQAEARRLAQVDPENDGAWLAFADLPGQPNTPVAGVRYVGVEPGVAEAALAVRDDLQSQGIGTELLRFLVEQARAAGVRKLTGLIRRSNQALWRILQKTSLPVTRHSEGPYTTIEVALAGANRADF